VFVRAYACVYKNWKGGRLSEDLSTSQLPDYVVYSAYTDTTHRRAFSRDSKQSSVRQEGAYNESSIMELVGFVRVPLAIE